MKKEMRILLNLLIWVSTIHGKTKKITSKYYIQVIVSKIGFKLGFKLLGETHSVSDFPDNFEYIIKKHKTLTSNPPINVYVNKTENRVAFKIKPGYFGFL